MAPISNVPSKLISSDSTAGWSAIALSGISLTLSLLAVIFLCASCCKKKSKRESRHNAKSRPRTSSLTDRAIEPPSIRRSKSDPTITPSVTATSTYSGPTKTSEREEGFFRSSFVNKSNKPSRIFRSRRIYTCKCFRQTIRKFFQDSYTMLF